MGDLEPRPGSDPARLRISDADRHRVAEILREAAGEGRLDLDELDERLEATYAARTYADLVPITSDLPAHRPAQAPAPRPAVGAAVRYDSSVAVMSGVTRKGVWEVGPTHTVFSLMGGADIDLREAVFTGPEVVITANTLMGGVDVIVNERTKVVVEGMGIMGAFEQARDKVEPQLSDDSPVVRVRGAAIMGAVTVVRKGPPRGRRPKSLHNPH
ncbi:MULTISPECIES: DUF1707 SHOCT-like domain-containing protein [unclassified Nocardioides]|uniref:DUF1707 SHOCT-like domain-containing protein n=1 Tax=unclassified Nocardioides TaxID=2615069 RepID=UPI00361AC11C